MEIERGALFWIDPQAERGSVPGSPHPHAVVSENVFNRSRLGRVIVCALTTNLKRASEPGNVLLDEGEGNLPRQSVIVCRSWRLSKSRFWARTSARFPRRASSKRSTACAFSRPRSVGARCSL